MAELPEDFFAAFSLPRKLVIDGAELDRRRIALSREYHPDRYTAKPAAEQAFATDITSMINDGYRVLRDPITRAEYVLLQAGLNVAEQRGKDVPQDLLEEVFELNMALEELRSGDEDARGAIEQAGKSFSQMLVNIDEGLAVEFAQHDAGEEGALARIRQILNKRRYIQNLLLDVERTLSGSSEPNL